MSSSESSDDERPVAQLRRKGGGQAKKRKISNEAASKKPMKKRNVKKKPDISSSDSDSDDEAEKESSNVRLSSKKTVSAGAVGSSSDEDDVPLKDLKNSPAKKTSPRKESPKTNGHGKESKDDSDGGVQSGGTEEFEAPQDDSDKEDDQKTPSSSSKNDSDADSNEKLAQKAEEHTSEDATVTKSGSVDTAKKPAAGNVDSSSDTSVYDSDPGGKLTKEKKGKEKHKEKPDKKSKEKPERGNKKQKPKPGGDSEENPRLTKLKRCIREAGLRCIYKQLFADCNSDNERIKKLEQFFRDKGFTGSVSVESAKAFRLKCEEEREMAELDMTNIIYEGRTRRQNVRCLGDNEGKSKKKESESEKTDSSDEEAASEAKRENQRLFSRLKDIVDSDESD